MASSIMLHFSIGFPPFLPCFHFSSPWLPWGCTSIKTFRLCLRLCFLENQRTRGIKPVLKIISGPGFHGALIGKCWFKEVLLRWDQPCHYLPSPSCHTLPIRPLSSHPELFRKKRLNETPTPLVITGRERCAFIKTTYNTNSVAIPYVRDGH